MSVSVLSVSVSRPVCKSMFIIRIVNMFMFMGMDMDLDRHGHGDRH